MKAVSVDRHGQQLPDDFSAFVQRESWTRQQIEVYQARALHACREYAYAHSPFYQRFHRGLMDRPLQELPVLTKTMMMEHFDELITDRTVHLQEVYDYLAHANVGTLFRDRYRIMTTSGSSGRLGLFLNDPTELVIMTNAYSRSLMWGGVTSSSRAAVVASAAPGHLTSQAPIVVNGQRVIPLQLSSMEKLETLVQRLNEFQPEVLFPYPSIAVTLAEEQYQGRLHIAPRSIFCAGEFMSAEMRQRIEAAWQTKLFQAYATTEGGALAAECEVHQGMHLFEDFSLIEVVDEDNRPVPAGMQGAKVLLTVLYRRAQPLIRYEISDLVRLSSQESCPCGRPFVLLESIEGRTAEKLYLPSDTGQQEGVTALQFESVFDTLPISGWQVIQEEDGLHILLTGISKELRDEQILGKLREVLMGRGVIVPDMKIQRVVELVRNDSGKSPMLISRLSARPS